MYCEECDMLVATDFRYLREEEDTKHYERWAATNEIRGSYDLADVGGGERKVHARVDYCANCGYTISISTYLLP